MNNSSERMSVYEANTFEEKIKFFKVIDKQDGLSTTATATSVDVAAPFQITR